MDVFKLREYVVDEYRSYVESFVNVHDERLAAYVRQRLDGGELWPEAVLQLNPAYEPAETLGELAEQGLLHADTARFFGPDLRLYRHQREAIDIARREEPYIVSTGTGDIRTSFSACFTSSPSVITPRINSVLASSLKTSTASS